VRPIKRRPGGRPITAHHAPVKVTRTPRPEAPVKPPAHHVRPIMPPSCPSSELVTRNTPRQAASRRVDAHHASDHNKENTSSGREPVTLPSCPSSDQNLKHTRQAASRRVDSHRFQIHASRLSCVGTCCSSDQDLESGTLVTTSGRSPTHASSRFHHASERAAVVTVSSVTPLQLHEATTTMRCIHEQPAVTRTWTFWTGKLMR
jgi:hypothetical protein